MEGTENREAGGRGEDGQDGGSEGGGGAEKGAKEDHPKDQKRQGHRGT